MTCISLQLQEYYYLSVSWTPLIYTNFQNNQRASEASELSPCSCQSRFQIYIYIYWGLHHFCMDKNESVTRMRVNLPLQRCSIVKRFVPVATVRTIVAKLCFTLKLLAVTAKK